MLTSFLLALYFCIDFTFSGEPVVELSPLLATACLVNLTSSPGDPLEP